MLAVFGTTPAGDTVHRISLRKGPLRAEVLTLGGIVQDLRLDGVPFPLVLGAESVEPYFGALRYCGGIVGRFANRISGGRFTVDGQSFDLSRNFLGKHTLHGGAQGSDVMLWSVAEQSDSHVRLELTLPEGHMGFPGTLAVTVTITLTDECALAFDITATTTSPTPCALAHHGYFNLDGGDDITGHRLQVLAERYTPVDDELIPDGPVRAVAETRFDFRQPQMIGWDGIDHNFCLSDTRRPLTPVARLWAAHSGLSMQVETTEPGLQVYDGGYLYVPDPVGLGGRRYGPNAGLALEAQAWPDAPNRPDFPDAILRPGQTYHQTTHYRFFPPQEARP
jgi:aldose 1-epimerase